MSKQIPAKAARAFRELIKMELNGNREKYQGRYRDILLDIAVWLGLQSGEVSLLFLDRAAPPAWVSVYPELLFLWSRARAAYKGRERILRHTIERERKSA
jgi:hypothetical protein